MSLLKDAMLGMMKKAIPHLPHRLVPGGKPDPLIDAHSEVIGVPTSRLDGARKVTGAAPFAAEFALDGMVYAAIAHSTIAKGRVTRIETAEASRAPGVQLVMTHHNAPKLKPIPYFLEADKAGAGDNLPVMQDDRIHWNGQPIAIVLATTHEQAQHASTLIRAEYTPEPAITSFAAARDAGLAIARFQGENLEHASGDAEAALAAAPHRVDAVYRTPRHNHNAIEPHAVTVEWRGNELYVHDATQGVSHTAWSLAEAFGIDEHLVHVTSPFVGGGFGSKMVWQHHVLAAAAARQLGRPVRLALPREGVYRLVGGRTCTEQRVAIGAQADGRFDALIHTGVVAITA
ncbi:MAG: xanthine dehydrogenase family protein molybdopterin-binding subunit, partial [Solirubrobacteraceae bacterium]